MSAPSIQVSVASLAPPDKAGLLAKQGGLRIFKKRWFVLKDHNLFYFKQANSKEASGMVVLGEETKISFDVKRNFFSIATYQRRLVLRASSVADMDDWMDHLHKAMGKDDKSKWQQAESPPVTIKIPPTVKEKLLPVKQCIPYLQDSTVKIVEFWDIWIESIPQPNDLPPFTYLDLQVATSASMQKLTWRMAGPQSTLVQKMVDFFWDVGSPDSELDKLNDVGGFIQPATIGSWIDMSGKGGMDGGWFFAAEMPISHALEASDPGHASRSVLQWTTKHKITDCFTVGRDMGSSPPRQSEIRVRLKGGFNDQLRTVLDAFEFFEFASIPPNVLEVIELAEPEDATKEVMCMSIITSSVGFVRLGILIPKPNSQTVHDLCALAPGVIGGMRQFYDHDKQMVQLATLESALVSSGPMFVEYQYTKEGFGYGVYQEGFDVVLHYHVGTL